MVFESERARRLPEAGHSRGLFGAEIAGNPSHCQSSGGSHHRAGPMAAAVVVLNLPAVTLLRCRRNPSAVTNVQKTLF